MQRLKRHKTKIYMIIIISLFQVILPLLTAMVENSYAVETEEYAKTKDLVEVEYSDDFKAWLELSEEEREEILMPKMYEIEDDTVETELYMQGDDHEEELPSRFALQEEIPKNVIVKDQVGSICWAYAGSAVLETSLALSDYHKGFTEIAYDVSERHMDYAVSTKNKTTGFNRSAGRGGSFYLAAAYLTNGLGAVSEEDVPISSKPSTIEDYEVISQVYDIVDYPYKRTSKITDDDIEEMKRHIMNYGGIYAAIYVDYGVTYNSAGAIYSSSATSGNHAVTIVGWDDNYKRTNFLSGNRPSSHGAWIVKNSWGDSKGDEGFYYVSYEDNVVYRLRYGISKASNAVNYDNIYQYNPYGASRLYNYEKENESDKVYIANIFERNAEEKEYLTDVSIYAGETYTCKVYVNPNGTSKSKKDLVEVELKYGDEENTETFCTGYHTLEFKNPIELTGESFVVVIEIQASGAETTIYGEAKSGGSYGVSGYNYDHFKNVTHNDGKCFYGAEAAFKGDEDEWKKFTSFYSDSTIKAFTVYEIEDDSLREILITNPPTQTHYYNGYDFDTTGMVITANFNNGESRELITGENAKYEVTNGKELKIGQTSVTISYTIDGVTETVVQDITVEENIVTSIEVATPPTQVEYLERNNFDTTGMIVNAKYKDGTVKEIANYKVENGTNLKVGQTSVIISYAGQLVSQAIQVKANPLEKIEITRTPSKVTYIEGQNFKTEGMIVTATYNNGDSEAIEGYTVTDGKNLPLGKTNVIISYTDGKITKTATQSIIVEKKKLEGIDITKVPEKTIYIEGENFEDEGMEVTIIYNNGDTAILKDYTVIDGDSLKLEQTVVIISYTEEGIAKTVEQEITVLEKLKISFEEYEEVELDNKNHIKHIKVNETIEEMKENITTNGEIKVYQGEEEITNATEKLATGMTVKITLREESEEYTVIVTGDTNGDGEANLHDILTINKHRLNKTSLEGEYLLAGDTNGDEKVNLNDILKINRYRLGKIDNL